MFNKIFHLPLKINKNKAHKYVQGVQKAKELKTTTKNGCAIQF
jgi:hypothetical protein